MRYSQRKPCSTRCRCSRAASQGKATEGQCPSGLSSRGTPCPTSTILASCLSLITFHSSNLKFVWSFGISIPSDRQCAPGGQSPALSCSPLFAAAPAQDGWMVPHNWHCLNECRNVLLTWTYVPFGKSHFLAEQRFPPEISPEWNPYKAIPGGECKQAGAITRSERSGDKGQDSHPGTLSSAESGKF